MNEKIKNELSEIEFILDKIKNQGVAYLQSLEDRPTSSHHHVVMNTKLADQGIGTQKTLEYFNQKFEPLMVASSGPKYWGFVTGGTTPAAIAGDWLTTIYDQNSFKTNPPGDVSAHIELETIQLLLDLFGLPSDYLGGFVTGATLSNFTSLAVARQWLGTEIGVDFAKEGLSQKLNVLSATPHSSALKALSLLGIGSANIIPIKTNQGNRESLDLVDFEKQIIALEGAPFILVSSAGTVNTVDFDDFEEISQLKKKHSFWWHIDAAFGGFAACSKAHQHLTKGWGHADSITIDCHKWLNVPYESAVFFIKETYYALQLETFQNSNAPYLDNKSGQFDFLNALPENSRRLKALPVWFSLMAYGKAGIEQIVDNSIQLAQYFGSLLEGHEAFELLAPIRLNTVCFTLSNPHSEARVFTFLSVLNDTNEVFMSATFYNGKRGIRAAFVNWRTTQKDVDRVYQLMTMVIAGISK
ncbi:MAG: aspartate aminotransferase family protein [Flammeovirgaceae bacterium]|jgi:glutamate/tyrosine decarboxylase-like PLP-dependent enzyme|nr:aspartate aminotransferase family protein [Flammeovirgaceae bacterium]|tara:strand:+ start:10123 stop:11532 length:1410 start_codon:yes stop_codon:yes gene_type:complete